MVRTDGGDSDSFDVKVGLHQGSILSPLLFVIVMEMVTRELMDCHGNSCILMTLY